MTLSTTDITLAPNEIIQKLKRVGGCILHKVVVILRYYPNTSVITMSRHETTRIVINYIAIQTKCLLSTSATTMLNKLIMNSMTHF